jgi:MbtH protein
VFTDDDGRLYRAVRNEEHQYSIWPADRPAPHGWVPAGEPGTKAECLRLVGRLWADMRPLSLRAASDAEP